ncbi:alpha/beta-hydrolase [Amanita rubescens]|nr:alpha/beta-hydrolase [Amanita rubescens]
MRLWQALLHPAALVGAASVQQIVFQNYHQLSDESHIPAQVDPLTIQAKPTTVYRPRSLEAHHNARFRSLHHAQSEPVEWDAVQTLGPDIEHKHTLVQLARMAGNAYALPGQRNWYDVDEAWNRSFPFGWHDSDDGFRGHVFVSSDNSTVVLSIKGTTLQGPTYTKDKFNDNLLFSCCCARVDITWIFQTVCDCYARHWRCDNQCLTDALVEDSLFYSVGTGLVDDLRRLYPSSNIWLVGHSLGGALASLLGATYGLPAVAFESPGERLAAQRLHLPLPPHALPPYNLDTDKPTVAVTHVYHNADPIPQGSCTGFGSPCAQAGYALETKCRLGKSIIFDTVGKLGWGVDVRRHIIRDVIHKVLEIAYVEWEDGREVPVARAELDCTECQRWEFGSFKKIDNRRQDDNNLFL